MLQSELVALSGLRVVVFQVGKRSRPPFCWPSCWCRSPLRGRGPEFDLACDTMG